ncbi:hypothetical protein GCM10027346_38650 [Hymenobacter seoulensis]
MALFTARVADDALLGPLFCPASGLASVAAAGPEYAWWELALTGHSYCGRPSSHFRHNPLSAAHLARWCYLLDDTLALNFSGPLSRAAGAALRNMAAMGTHWQLVSQRRPATVKAPAPVSRRMAA